ncbi:MAG: hypothetical protein AB2565_13470, partial [Candidatus Thiodiazotropha endolucinida]
MHDRRGLWRRCGRFCHATLHRAGPSSNTLAWRTSAPGNTLTCRTRPRPVQRRCHRTRRRRVQSPHQPTLRLPEIKQRVFFRTTQRGQITTKQALRIHRRRPRRWRQTKRIPRHTLIRSGREWGWFCHTTLHRTDPSIHTLACRFAPPSQAPANRASPPRKTLTYRTSPPRKTLTYRTSPPRKTRA